MKRTSLALLVSLAALLAPAASGGPGGSGGNPMALVSSLERGYLFRTPYPTAVSHGAEDRYEFALLGYDVVVAPRPYDPALCARESLHKTVCTTRAPHEVSSLVVFGDTATFAVTVVARGASAPLLGEVHDELIRGFVRGP